MESRTLERFYPLLLTLLDSFISFVSNAILASALNSPKHTMPDAYVAAPVLHTDGVEGLAINP